MPRTAPAPRAEVVKDGAKQLTAAVAVYPGTGKKVHTATRASWQKKAWDLYDKVGELRYGVNWIANVSSRAVLYAARREPDGSIVKAREGSASRAALDELFGGPKGQSKMLKAFALHLSVAGECYLVGRERQVTDTSAETGDVWEVVGTEEISTSAGDWWITYEDRKIKLHDSDVVIRIWMPHPKNRTKADSPVKAIIDPLEEVVLLSSHIKAQTTSRLTGAGVFAVPSELEFNKPPNVPETDTNAQAFTRMLGSAMSAAINKVGSAEAQVPIVVTAPGESIAAMKHFHFWSDLDEKAIEMRREAIRRVALGLDIPEEAVLGSGDVNRWGAWQIEESSIKAHIEPLLEQITAALSAGYLEPITHDANDIVAFDTSVLRLRPNRSKEAIELYDRGILSEEALLRETGFGEDDQIDEEGLRHWVLLKMVTASWSPEQAQAAAAELGVKLDVATTDNEPRQARPTPSLRDHPTRDRPERSVEDGTAPNIREREQANSEAAMAITMLAWRAMERAGNRLRTLTNQQKSEPNPENTHLLIQPYPDKVDDLLKDAWGPIKALPIGLHFDPRQAMSVADGYCRDLLVSQREFNIGDCYRHIIERI